jgi:DNA-binding IclR family transcriptional regulator
MRYDFSMSAGDDPKNIVGSIIKASSLMDLFTLDRRQLGLNEFAREVGYNKTTTYRLLQTLVAAGWLVRSTSGTYRLGPRPLVLGAIARADLDLRNEALPFMQALSEEFGDTAFLMIPGDRGAVTIEAIQGGNPIRVHGVGVGTTLPYHVAAGPVVLAAFSSEIEAEILAQERTRFTKQTTMARGALRSKFAQVRKDGYSVSLEDYVDDVAAVAAPVLDRSGTATAALSVGGPSNHFAEPLLSRIVERVCFMAAQLSEKLVSQS